MRKIIQCLFGLERDPRPGSVFLLCPPDGRDVFGDRSADPAAADRCGCSLVVLAALLHSGESRTGAQKSSHYCAKKQFLSLVMSFLMCK